MIRTLHKVIEHEAPLCPFKLEFSAKGADMIEYWDLDTKRHIFRIVQELLNNARKHSQASNVSITITSLSNQILLIYRDDGIGFPSHPIEHSEIGSSGTGIEQMKNRILSLEGKWEIRTDTGSGVYLTVTIPMRKVA
ncbi:hypothetical protein G9U52_36240 [Paenibacillus sp. S3N08]|uniref:Histidine kinase domain-containing protein n=1 Tax=Paenibacillus agricola TaxID=2716264 RepID=A0ABX0JH89_9BACL|nr:hypothetical protein [Paenibacillus agricola]